MDDLILDGKQVKKFIKKIGSLGDVKEIADMDDQGLKSLMSDSEMKVQKITDEMKSSEAWLKASDDLKLLREALRDKTKADLYRKRLCMHLLKVRNSLEESEEE